MNNEQPTTDINAMKQQLFSMCKEMDLKEKDCPVSGTRNYVELEGRTLETIIYPAKRKNAPVLFGLHGGGFIMGTASTDDLMWDTLRKELDVTVISISYRKAPDYPYPAALDDSYDCIKYYLQNATEYGLDCNQVLVFGSSAGANLAASVCLMANKRNEFKIHLQILTYPYLDMFTSPEEKGHPEEELFMYHLFPDTFVSSDLLKSPLVSPVYADSCDLQGLPRTIIAVGGADALRSEGITYEKMLEAANVCVTLKEFDRMPHGFWEMAFYYQAHSAFFMETLKPLVEDGSLLKAQSDYLRLLKESI